MPDKIYYTTYETNGVETKRAIHYKRHKPFTDPKYGSLQCVPVKHRPTPEEAVVIMATCETLLWSFDLEKIKTEELK